MSTVTLREALDDLERTLAGARGSGFRLAHASRGPYAAAEEEDEEDLFGEDDLGFDDIDEDDPDEDEDLDLEDDDVDDEEPDDDV